MTSAVTAPSETTVIEKTPLKPAEAAQGLGGLTNLVGMTREELTEAIVGLGEAPFRAKQLWHWIYHRGERDFAAMNCPMISPAPRLRVSRCVPVWQKRHDSVQPTCEEMHTAPRSSAGSGI